MYRSFAERKAVVHAKAIQSFIITGDILFRDVIALREFRFRRFGELLSERAELTDFLCPDPNYAPERELIMAPVHEWKLKEQP